MGQAEESAFWQHIEQSPKIKSNWIAEQEWFLSTRDEPITLPIEQLETN
jgi:hypothetical protein